MCNLNCFYFSSLFLYNINIYKKFDNRKFIKRKSVNVTSFGYRNDEKRC